jgi:hypothetical protein
MQHRMRVIRERFVVAACKVLMPCRLAVQGRLRAC